MSQDIDYLSIDYKKAYKPMLIKIDEFFSVFL